MAYIGQTAPVSLAADATVTNLTVTGTVDFDASGNIDGPITGATTPAAGTFTTLQATSLDSTPIGGSTPAAGTFTTAEANHFRLGNVSSGASGATLVPGQFFVSTASGQTVTLPASPSPGDTVYIGVQNFIDTVVGRNGEPIMSVAQDMTIDTVNVTLTFTYIDSTIGWRVY